MALSRCGRCGFAWFPRSLYAGRQIEAQYVEDITSPVDYYRMVEPFDLETFSIRMTRVVELTGLKTGRILDIGCNVGSFLQAAARFGWTAVGVEPNPRAAEMAEAKGFEVHRGFFDESLAARLGRFDAVHAGDVIEHLFTPIDFLVCARRVLRGGALLMIVTPDIDSALGRLLQIKPTEHLVYFTRASLRRSAELAGFHSAVVRRWGRRRSISAMRYSTTFSPRARRLVGLLDVPGLRGLIELFLYRLLRDELLLTAFSPQSQASI
jgi:2-polyprenyl-3-methyl-5-hydroxy-6-metoxy-1,4-benzoquinol methylase